jgi:hypothetical protein
MLWVRNRSRLVAACAVFWHVAMIAVVSAAVTCDLNPPAEHAGMENCPMKHQSEPACPLHAEKHGTRDCDCPTIGCSPVDVGFMALFGTIGVLPAASDIRVPFDSTDLVAVSSPSTVNLSPAPLSPPPRS